LNRPCPSIPYSSIVRHRTTRGASVTSGFHRTADPRAGRNVRYLALSDPLSGESPAFRCAVLDGIAVYHP